MKHTWKPGDHARLKFSGYVCTLVKKMPFGETSKDAYWWVETEDGKWKGTVSSLSFQQISEPVNAPPGAQMELF